jgi:hypothetical protein
LSRKKSALKEAGGDPYLLVKSSFSLKTWLRIWPIIFKELFGVDKNKQLTERDFRISTIQSIKDETVEAAIIILKQKGIGSY